PQTTTPTTETPTTSTATTTPTTTTLTAQDDTYTVTYSTESQLVGSVYDNDRYGTATPTDKEVQFSYVRRSTDNNGKYISTIRGGMLRLPAGLSVGRHYVYYKIRDIKDATHFATATATVIVLPQTTTPTTETPTTSTSTTTPTTSTATTTPTTTTLTAQDDIYTVTYSTEPQTVGSVYDNDRYGTATPTDKEVQFSYVRRSTDNNGKYISTIRGGMLRLPAGLSVGHHYVYYKIRDIKDVTHFATATATVIVLPQATTPTTSTSTTTPTTTTSTTITLTAQDDTYTVTYSNEPQIVGSVYENDRYGIATPTDKEVQFLKLNSSVDNNGKYISTIRGGMLRLPAGLSVGRHYVYYKIRDIKDATHSATATATVIVLPQTTTPTTSTSTTTTSTTHTTTTSTTITLTAQDDTYTVTYSTESQLVGSIYDNDGYGTATPTDKEVQFSYVRRSTDNNGKYISTIRGGMLRLPAGLSVGRHYVYYKIRDIKDATHSATATATVIVLPKATTPTTSTATTTPTTTTLTAQDDTYTVTYSTESQLVGSVYDNDHYGTQTPTDKDVQFSYVRRSTDNNGKFISTIRGGMLRLPAGLAVGRHYVYYKIRDIKDVTHSATATATVIVLPQTTTPTTETPTTSTATTTPTTTTLTTQDDTYTVTYSNDPQTVGSVYDNDRYGTATPTDKEVQFLKLSSSVDNNGKYISTGRGGMLRLPAGLAVGRHYVYYKIRDIKDVTHSATATATVIVLPKTTTPTTSTATTTPTTTTSTTTTLTAQDDTYTITYSTDPQTVGSVYDNDHYGTATPTDKEVHFSYVRRSTDNNGKYISTTRGGMLRLPAALSVGHHYVYYKIRDIKDITHFATATATVIVLPQTTTPTTETPTTSTATTTPTTTTLTAQDDTYTVTYSIDPQLVGSVYDNDHYGTATPTDKEVQFSYVRRSTDDNGKYISTAQGGMLRLPAGLSVGRHYVYYKIRDIKDATHFATATATVIVLPKTTTPTTSTATTASSTTITNTTITLTAQDDTYTVTYSTEPQMVGSVYDNDRYGSATPTDKEVQFSYVRRSTDNNGKYISTTQGGMLHLPAGLSVGRHYVYYKIRDIKDVTHFATATATVIVLLQTTTPTTETPTTSTATTTPTTTTSTTITLTAQDDTYTVTYSADPQTIGSVYDNDRYGTATPTDKEVQFSYVRRSTDDNGKYISTTRGGMLRLPAGLSVGHHYVYYKIRDIKDATHFATATATVIVLPQTTTPTTETPTTSTSTTTNTTITLTAQDDTYTVTYSTESQLVGSVYDNDRYGTATPTDKEVQFSYVRRSTDDNGKYISTAQGGMLRLPAGLSVGRHYVYYKIRDIKDATHFATATATVIVLPQTTTPTTETPTTSTATTTPTTTTLTAQDDTYTVTYSNEPQTVGSVYDNDRYGTATPTDKDVQFSYVRRSTDNNGKYISTVRGGMLRLPAGLSVGRHYVYYKIRDIKDATHFATATATVIVLLKTTTPTTSTSTTTPTTTTSTTITLTAQDDTYTVTYNTDPQIVGSVYDNDRYGTTTPTDKEVQFSYVRRSTDNNGKYISTARGGMLRLPAGLSVGRHYVYYKIRDIKDVTHFATATATVIVLPQTTTPSTETPTTSTSTTTPTTTTSTTITLTAQDDTYTVTYSAENQLVGSVYDNDRYGTATPTDKEVQFSYVRRSTDNNGKFISTAQGGMLRLPAGLSVGRHYVHYKIRDIKDITHFATATATVIVLPQTTTPTTKTPTTEEPLRPIAVADAVTTPMNTPVLIAILQNDIPYDAVPYISAFPYKGSVTLNDSNEVLYTPNSNTTGADSFTYELRSPDAAISLATTTVTVKIWSPITPCTGISANGDGKNDYFHIMGIENYPENTLTIYDSNANKVFSVSHYDNEVCRFEGANLPQGVYFFVLTYRDEDDNLEQQVGWFYLKK
ncbi:T9SS type B sorting domain-containing protein, partial [Capnocytophaga bilenii]